MKIILITFMLIFKAQAQIQNSGNDRPLYEVGFLSGVANVPHYPAADQSSTNVVAAPSFIYRGFTFRSDDKGNRFRFFTSEKIDVDLSFGFAFRAAAAENEARRGMDDLDWLFEIGPRFSYMIYQNDRFEFEFEFPLRFVYSTDFDFTRHRGFRFQPQIDYRLKFAKYFLFGAGYKLNYGTEELNDYFYEVTPRDVTSEREEFNAKAGLIGQDFSTNIIFRYKGFLAIAGVRRSQFHDTANEDSPLFRTRENTATFFAFNYFFYKSDRLAPKNIYSRTPTQ